MKVLLAGMLGVGGLIISSAMTGCGCSRSTDEDLPADDAEAVVMPDSTLESNNEEEAAVRLYVRPLGGSLGAVFNDINNVHLPVAQELGISPINGLRDAWNVNRPLKRIESCDAYRVDKLTHSLPYLIPEAADLLQEIGTRFNDTLAARGGGNYQIKVTSVLRTEGAVKKLRRNNINATQQSAHRYGTTFDISYSKFVCDSVTVPRTQEDLKNLLGEILKDLREEGRCYVKYERKQGCFHITARQQSGKTAKAEE